MSFFTIEVSGYRFVKTLTSVSVIDKRVQCCVCVSELVSAACAKESPSWAHLFARPWLLRLVSPWPELSQQFVPRRHRATPWAWTLSECVTVDRYWCKRRGQWCLADGSWRRKLPPIMSFKYSLSIMYYVTHFYVKLILLGEVHTKCLVCELLKLKSTKALAKIDPNWKRVNFDPKTI